jgi:hypothetical protein
MTIEAFQRRLALIPFPMEFRSPDEMPAAPLLHQRIADDGIKRAMPKSSPELVWWCQQLAPIVFECPFAVLQPRPDVVVEATNGFVWNGPEEGINPAARFIEERLEITSSYGADARSKINAAYGREQHMTELQASRELQRSGLLYARSNGRQLYQKNVGGSVFYMKLR